jgi:hypothetical protein
VVAILEQRHQAQPHGKTGDDAEDVDQRSCWVRLAVRAGAPDRAG